LSCLYTPSKMSLPSFPVGAPRYWKAAIKHFINLGEELQLSEKVIDLVPLSHFLVQVNSLYKYLMLHYTWPFLNILRSQLGILLRHFHILTQTILRGTQGYFFLTKYHVQYLQLLTEHALVIDFSFGALERGLTSSSSRRKCIWRSRFIKLQSKNLLQCLQLPVFVIN